VTDADVCIVGAGAAGGVMAHELARRGVRVVVLESGPRHEFSRRRQYVTEYLHEQNPWRTRRTALDRETVGGTMPYRLEGRRVRGVGGSTLAWEGTAIRFHADDFRLRSRHGVGDDWPVSYADLEPYYGIAERMLGVAGAADDPTASPRSTPFPLPPFPFSHSDALFARGSHAAGLAVHHLPQARNSVAYGGRARCQACGTCMVCPTGAKASIDLTHIPQAEATGNATVLAESTVLRLETDPAGAVSAAVHAGPDRIQRRVRAGLFVLAAGAVENARLLLLSTSPRFPTGLANRSGLVGRYFMSHPSIDVLGRSPQRVHPFRIGFSTAMSRRFAVGGERATRAAFLVEFLNSAGPTPARIAMTSGTWGADLRRQVREEFGRWLGLRVYAEQLADRRNAVALAAGQRDHFGNPAVHLQSSIGAYERRGLDEAAAVATRLMTAMGLTDIRAHTPTFAAHQIGTHRMGADPVTSVVDRDLRAHDVPNLYLVGSGCFVSATASPPTLTIVALAARAAEHIAGRLGRVP
jgi:choline dehydrogenase-like flavoprotein